MSLPKFKHMTPSTLDEALGLLQKKGKKARIMAGGTDLVVSMKQRTEVPEFLVNIKKLQELDFIRPDPDDGITIGSLTILEAISQSEQIKEELNPLALAAGRVASFQIRNVGTIGGNICLNTRCWYYNQSAQWRNSIPRCFKMGGESCMVIKGSEKCNAIFLADTVPALIALDADLKIVKQNGERKIPVRDFYNGSGDPPNLLRPEEILTEIHVPKRPMNSFGVFFKNAPREVVDFAMVNVAMQITFQEGNGACKDAKIAVGGVTSFPVRSVKGEEVLKGEKITEKLMDEVAEVVVNDSTPISPIWVSPNLRRETIKALIKRGLQAAQAFSREL